MSNLYEDIKAMEDVYERMMRIADPGPRNLAEEPEEVSYDIDVEDLIDKEEE